MLDATGGITSGNAYASTFAVKQTGAASPGNAPTLPIASDRSNVFRCRCVPTNGSFAMQLHKGLRALANPTRLRVLELLRDPSKFDGPRAADGRPLGVTAKALLKHLRCSQPSLNEQMQVLIDLGLVESRKVGRWVVYTRDEERIRQLKQTIVDQLLPPASA